MVRDAHAAVAILSADLLFVTDALKRRILDALSPELALDDASLLFVASHTHFAPSVDPSKPLLGRAAPTYIDFVADRAVELVRRLAATPAAPGRLIHRTGAAQHAINRRRLGWGLSRYGVPRRVALRAPDPAGPRDETVHVLELVDAAGRPVALAWSYACHPVSFPEPTRVSADFPGVARRALRAAYGDGLPVLFLQGCAGDIRPRELGRPRSVKRRFAELVVGKLFTPFTVPEYAAWSQSLAARVVDVARAPGAAHELGPTAAIERVNLADLMTGAPTGRTVSFQRVRLSPAVSIAAVSAEPVAEYGLAVRALGRGAVIPAGYSDSVFGYLPSARMLGQHGYEDEGFLEPFGLAGAEFRPQVERVVRAACERLLAT